MVYKAAKGIILGDCQYRNDGFTDAKRKIESLKKLGYWDKKE